MVELLARIQACLRRAPKAVEAEDNLVLGQGDLIIELSRHRVWVRQRYVHLTKTEFELLVYLARNRGRALAHTLLITAIWGEDSVVGQVNLKQLVDSLRRKIELDPSHPEWLVMERGVGYTLSLA
jgi:DNA-binding response OmpR family regulator